ncbi:MAG TPA: cytochrome c [Vicinamibacterales bacterium]|nr:cytochrome c [Vicinamibacterales bacterium]
MGRFFTQKMVGLLALPIMVIPALVIAQQQPPPPPKVVVEPAKPIPASDGAAMFKGWCGPCHGVSGKGDGPAAAALNPKPADLTQFAKRRNGTFSAKDFEDKVNGMAMSPAHGSTDMPIWGPIFRQLGNEQLRMVNLRKYVESLQVR